MSSHCVYIHILCTIRSADNVQPQMVQNVRYIIAPLHGTIVTPRGATMRRLQSHTKTCRLPHGPSRFGSSMRSRVLARFGPVRPLVDCGERIVARTKDPLGTEVKLSRLSCEKSFDILNSLENIIARQESLLVSMVRWRYHQASDKKRSPLTFTCPSQNRSGPSHAPFELF